MQSACLTCRSYKEKSARFESSKWDFSNSSEATCLKRLCRDANQLAISRNDSVVRDGLNVLRESDCCSLGREPVSWQDLRRFSMKDTEDTMRRQSPHLFGILQALVKGKANEEADSTRLQALITGTVALKFRDRQSSGIALLTAYMLVCSRYRKTSNYRPQPSWCLTIISTGLATSN